MATAETSTHPTLALAPLFTDGVILQQGKPVTVWGVARPGENISVKFRDALVHTTANKTGTWNLQLPAFEATCELSEIVVTGNTELVVRDVLVGEVWLCSGQSNMEMPVSDAADASAEIAGADFPLIRQVKLTRNVADHPRHEAETSGWLPALPNHVGSFSAAAYSFSRSVFRHLGVPIGLIQSTWGGTPVEAWTSREGLSSDARFSVVHKRWNRWIAGAPEREKHYQASLADYEERRKKAANKGDESLASFLRSENPPAPPAPSVGSQDTPSGLFNAMIAPLIPCGIRGTLWYQGEANTVRAAEYSQLFQALISDWREKFGQGDTPFYWAQLANFRDNEVRDPTGRAWAFLREAQSEALSLPNTGQVVTLDVGDNADIHPKNKKDVGERLARLALKRTYGIHQEDSGPVCAGTTVNGSRINIYFAHAENGLLVRGNSVNELEIAGNDGVFHPASGNVSGNVLTVFSPEVAEPVAVRYAFKSAVEANLFGKNGLPAAPFRSDRDRETLG